MNKVSYRLFLFTLKAIPYVIALFYIIMYYNVEEDSEAAAYLSGFIAQKMYRCFRHFT